MNRQEIIRVRKVLRDALVIMETTGFSTAFLEREIDKVETALVNGGPPKKEKWSGTVYAPSAEETDVLVTPDGDVIVGSSTAREQEAYEQCLRVMTVAMSAMARQMRRTFTYHEVKYAIKGAAWNLSNGASRLVYEATQGEQTVVPKQEDDSDLAAFTFIGDDDGKRQPEQSAPPTTARRPRLSVPASR